MTWDDLMLNGGESEDIDPFSKSTRKRAGKRIGGAVYLHVSALATLTANQRERVDELRLSVGDHWNVVKIKPGAISLLAYEDFDTVAFPRLRHAWRIDENGVKHDDYTRRDNPPILHRKELLLLPDDPRVDFFSELTRQAVEKGLFANSHKIGTARAWEERLGTAGLVVIGHRLVSSAEPIARHRTAIVRNKLSAPMQQLVLHGFIGEGATVFDYGCGQGDDVRTLREGGIKASGWDPYYAPSEPRIEADVVNLGFVLNVIEDPEERREVLRCAFALARRAMAIAVMTTAQRPEGLREHGDGHLTSRGTFQRYFLQSELRELVFSALGQEPVAAAPGIMLAFRDPVEQEDFLERRQTRRRDWPTTISFASPERLGRDEATRGRLAPLVEDVAGVMLRLGRPPASNEILASTRAALSEAGMSVARSIRLAGEEVGGERLLEAERARSEDLTLYFAMRRFEKRSAATVSDRIRRDVRHFWGSTKQAEAAGTDFLFSLGDKAVLERAVEEAVADGRAHSAEPWVHFRADAATELPLALRGFLACATVIHGGIEEVEIVALDVAARRIRLMRMVEFDARLPMIERSATISLPRQDMRDQSFPEGGRRIFLGRSRYALDDREMKEREQIEVSIRSLLGLPEKQLTCREADLATALRQATRTSAADG